MGELPAIDLLNAGHAFPGPYLFKVIGKAENGFVARTVAAVRDALEATTDPPYTVRESVGGRHVAVSLNAEVRTAGQVLDVYRRVRALSGLVMCL
jgi:putative lipoic acid-binding regulatory protein